ncbi:histidine kinase [Actinomadura latina]|uniref:histidine kinase n=1 Tax=Actinomadura latina TaxID=163603 RepID=A0A846Z6L6_9ACTN|nr:histidine kinase [Actinomadura latina]NKZ08709.1 sensor histidine kinase [Actinomadura latina]
MNDSAAARARHTAARTAARTARALRPHALRTAIRRPTRAALAKDALLYAVLAFPTAVTMISPLRPGQASWWLQGAGLAALAAAVAVCRTHPTAALLTAISLTALHGNFAFAMPVLSYLTGLRTRRAQPVLWGFTAVLIGGVLLSIARGLAVTTWFPSTVWLVLLGVLPWLVGRYWRQHQELLRAGWERAERLEHQQRIIAERERLRERARIAQDMHDSLGHELALIAVRAGALQVAQGLDDRYRAAAAELRTGAADATDRLREIIGVLREDAGEDTGEDPAAPVRPTRETIPDLVDRARASGVPVHLTGTLPDLAPMAALTAHRVVQEAITNAAKHAPGAAVTVTLTGPGDGTGTVTVANDPPPGHPPPLPAGGRGLTGLTERVRLLGGTLHAAPAPGGGFTVTADIPNTAPAPRPRQQAPPTTPGEWPSESARHLARERLQVRRGLITAITVPAALMALLGAITAGYHVCAALNSVLPPAHYAALRIGTPQHQVEQNLPRMETTDSGVVHAVVPEPAHADCRYYRPDADLLGVSRIYRLCFSGGRLTAKNSYDTSRLSTAHRTDQENE